VSDQTGGGWTEEEKTERKKWRLFIRMGKARHLDTIRATKSLPVEYMEKEQIEAALNQNADLVAALKPYLWSEYTAIDHLMGGVGYSFKEWLAGTHPALLPVAGIGTPTTVGHPEAKPVGEGGVHRQSYSDT